jgi:RNA polymerase sigma factor (sigma-70 family)
MDERPDQELVEAVARGDAAALRSLYFRYERPVFNLILRLAGNRALAEELMQETFTRLWTMAGTFRPERGELKGWLFTVALNATRSELARKRYRVRHVEAAEADALASPTDGPEALAARAQDARRVADALARLPLHSREVVVMRIYHQLTFPEIAAVTGTPEGTLRARFHRAVDALRLDLGGKDRR